MRALSELEGLIPEEVGVRLAELAALVPPGRAIVEVGSFKGKSTCYLASGAKPDVVVYAIDPWDLDGNVTGRFGFAEPSTRERFEQQIREMGLEWRIIAIRGFSQDIAKRWEQYGEEVNTPAPIGLLFIDGDHRFESVFEDAKAWAPHLAPGAIVVLDDLDTPKNPGVRKAAEQLRPHFGQFSIEAGRLAVFRP